MRRQGEALSATGQVKGKKGGREEESLGSKFHKLGLREGCLDRRFGKHGQANWNFLAHWMKPLVLGGEAVVYCRLAQARALKRRGSFGRDGRDRDGRGRFALRTKLTRFGKVEG